jgi:tRNA guanosine-2'-O-methyltransferase
VASLIENPYNLGGLSRASEIFGAQAMYVRDPRVVAEKDFASVAVSSHNHIDILPLPVPDISAWVAGKKSEGWTVVGIEQTDRSVLLGDASAVLPEKTILVLGSEREGMPAAVLGECDLLVEIPQVGVTRSLNVQVAAAIVLFEYGRQHGRK